MFRTSALITVVALSVGCSFSYSSSSSSRSPSSQGSASKPVSKSGSKQVDPRTKPIRSGSSGGTKPVKADPPAKPAPPGKVDPPERTKPTKPPERTKPGTPEIQPAGDRMRALDPKPVEDDSESVSADVSAKPTPKAVAKRTRKVAPRGSRGVASPSKANGLAPTPGPKPASGAKTVAPR